MTFILTIVYMSLAAFAKKAKTIVSPHSEGANGFSTVGGYRNQPNVGHVNLGASRVRTPFRGAFPVGNGGLGEPYTISILGGSKCCVNNPNVIKKASLNTKGMLATRFKRQYNPATGSFDCPRVMFNSVYPYTWVQAQYKDFTAGGQIRKVATASEGCVTSKTNSGQYSCEEKKSCRIIQRAGSRLMPPTPFSKTISPVSSSEYVSGRLLKAKCLSETVDQTNNPNAPFPVRTNGNRCGGSLQTVQQAIQGGYLPANHVNAE
ncbi:MAG: hypothetical protein CL669_04385 [Balneola sp.]|nr:hypothetical protein [Balneola sp.]